jgi:hypothetical protein
MDNNEPQKKSFRERVLEDIEAKNVQTYSKAHFTFRVIMLAIISFLVLVISVFIFNFVFFYVRISGHNSLLGFGPEGFLFFLQAFPWAFFIVDVSLIIILEWLVRKFRFGYRSPVLYLLLGLLAVTISIGFCIDRFGLNDDLLHQADMHRLPGPFEEMYEAVHSDASQSGMCRCTITAINGDMVVATDFSENTTTVVMISLPPDSPALGTLKVGDVVFIAGLRSPTGTIQAFGVSSFPH